MPNPVALNMLIELAQQETERAAKWLGAALRVREESGQKLDLLQGYRDDYAKRCESNLVDGISTTHFNNFRGFMQKLDDAIHSQQKVVREAGLRADEARAAWMRCEQKKMSFVTLVSRSAKASAQHELRRDQKQNDELAARQTMSKPNPLWKAQKS